MAEDSSDLWFGNSSTHYGNLKKKVVYVCVCVCVQVRWEMLALCNSFLVSNWQFSIKTFTGHFIIANKTYERTACAYFRAQTTTFTHALCPLIFPCQWNVPWASQTGTQPAVKRSCHSLLRGLEPQTLTGPETEFGSRCGWAKRNSVKPRTLIMMHRRQAASGAARAFSPLQMNLPS